MIRLLFSGLAAFALASIGLAALADTTITPAHPVMVKSPFSLKPTPTPAPVPKPHPSPSGRHMVPRPTSSP